MTEKWKLPLLLRGKQWNQMSYFTTQQNTDRAFWTSWSLISGLGNDSENRMDSHMCCLSASIKQHITHKGPHIWGYCLPRPLCLLVPISPPFHSPPRQKRGTGLRFHQLWIWTMELRCRIIFFLSIVVSEWSSFSFKLKISWTNDIVIVLYGGRW